MKTEFKNFVFRSKIFKQNSEFLKVECHSNIIEHIIQVCNTMNWKISKISDYTGCKESVELKNFNIEMGIIQKPEHFYSKGQERKIYLPRNK